MKLRGVVESYLMKDNYIKKNFISWFAKNVSRILKASRFKLGISNHDFNIRIIIITQSGLWLILEWW